MCLHSSRQAVLASTVGHLLRSMTCASAIATWLLASSSPGLSRVDTWDTCSTLIDDSLPQLCARQPRPDDCIMAAGKQLTGIEQGGPLWMDCFFGQLPATTLYQIAPKQLMCKCAGHNGCSMEPSH